MRAANGTVLVLFACVGLVMASVFPTHPVATSTWTAGQFEWITWKDDGRWPHLRQMSPLNIDLYSVEGIFVRTLAHGVQPTSRLQRIYTPKSLRFDGTYFLRITCKQPRATFYTANFDIRSMAASELINSSKPEQTPLTLDYTTMTHTLPMAATTIYADPLPGRRSGSRNSGGIFASSRLDLEKFKFKFVFMIWPALIGVSLAI
ncbi:hypothetical protein HGRIS_014306 [Hohenbuehelia grisea]|uniref:Uncharacterized protein n=1 Tax=Hohenbuehelia grisea TaxID=104357 RepID=A0ABR3JV54_9AGAR